MALSGKPEWAQCTRVGSGQLRNSQDNQGMVRMTRVYYDHCGVLIHEGADKKTPEGAQEPQFTLRITRRHLGSKTRILWDHQYVNKHTRGHSATQVKPRNNGGTQKKLG